MKSLDSSLCSNFKIPKPFFRISKEKIPDCTELSSAPGSCFMKFDDNGLFQDAVDKCNAKKGLMPRASDLATTQEMLSTLSYAQGIWVGLKTKSGQ